VPPSNCAVCWPRNAAAYGNGCGWWRGKAPAGVACPRGTKAMGGVSGRESTSCRDAERGSAPLIQTRLR
jgi:hypothetical protein